MSIFAPFKRNKGKGSLRRIEQEWDLELKAYNTTLAQMDDMIAKLDSLAGYMRKPNIVHLYRYAANIRNSHYKKQVPGRVNVRWVINASATDNNKVTSVALPLYRNQEAFELIASLFHNIDGRKTVINFEFQRIELLGQVNTHISRFKQLVDERNTQMLIREG